MASTDSDLQTDLRKRARRRLLGAIALALTAAIVLPIVMDHEPRPPAQDIAVRIPSRESLPPLPSPSRDVRPDAEVVEPAPPPAPPDSEPSSTSRPELSRPQQTSARPDAVKPEMPRPAQPQPEAPAPVSKPEARVEAKPAPGANSAEAARAASLLDGRGSTTSYALQLGVFSDSANVEKLRARAKALGYPSFTEEVKLANGQLRTRVKVGPFPNRAAAEAAGRKLESAGMRSMVTPRP